MKQSSESSAVLFETEPIPVELFVSIGIWQRIRHRSRLRRACRSGRTRRRSIRSASIPSSSAARRSPRRARSIAAHGRTASGPRSRIALRRDLPAHDSQRALPRDADDAQSIALGSRCPFPISRPISSMASSRWAATAIPPCRSASPSISTPPTLPWRIASSTPPMASC